MMPLKMMLKAIRCQNTRMIRLLSTSQIKFDTHKCKVLVVGGGSGGCSVAAKLSHDFKDGEILVLEPNDKHYYQPMFTLIGGGILSLTDSFKPMGKVLPKKGKWIKDEVANFYPKENKVETKLGDVIHYDYMLVAIGLQLNYDEIPGLVEALNIPNGKVCSNYSPKYVERTFTALKNFNGGTAVFTLPNTPVKCPGAPQKILYITEHYFRKTGKRESAKLVYNTSLGVLFGVKLYADALWKVVEKRGIDVNLRTNLIEVKGDTNEAVFVNLDSGEKTTIEYALLHATPPMSTPTVLKSCKELTNEAGFLDVCRNTLQHKDFENVFGIGDCTSTPNSKTAASVAGQCQIVYKNMKSKMAGKPLQLVYDGYASCPLVTGYDSCIMAEFDYNLSPLETFPVSQDKERYSMYLMKKYFMPFLYWHFMLNGYWNGPAQLRKAMHCLSPSKSNI